jgi:hypothetical protein
MSNYRVPTAQEIECAEAELRVRKAKVDAMWDQSKPGLHDAIRFAASLDAWIELAKEGRVIRVVDEVIA